MSAPTSYDSLTLAAVVDALQPFCGARLQRVTQPGEHALLLTVYAQASGEASWLIDCSTAWARTHLITRRLSNPSSPSPFCMTLRKYLEGGQILSIRQRGFDRILDIEVRGHEGHTYTLSAEFMGKHSNIMLVSPDNIILQVAKLVSSRINRVREILPGRSYVPPPATGKLDPRSIDKAAFLLQLHEETPDDFNAWLRRKFEGMSPVPAAEIVFRAGSVPTLESCWLAFEAVFQAVRASNWQPVLVRNGEGNITGAYPLPLTQIPSELQERQPAIHLALERYYEVAVPRAELEQQRKTLLGALNKTLAMRSHALDQVRQGTSESGKMLQYRRWGELLLAQLHEVGPNATQAQLLDYYADPPAPIAIPLDPLQTPQANAERFFQRARRLERNAENLKDLESQLTVECSRLHDLLTQVSVASDATGLERFREQAASQGWLQSATAQAPGQAPARANFDGKRVRAMTSPDGWEVLVGENAEANDYLVRQVAQSNDWWLHVRAGTSAHVVIRTGNAPQRVQPDTLLFAARQAAAHSRGKHAGLVAVDYTLRKYVRRPRKAAPGMVTYTHEKTLDVVPAELGH